MFRKSVEDQLLLPRDHDFLLDTVWEYGTNGERPPIASTILAKVLTKTSPRFSIFEILACLTPARSASWI